MDTFKCLIIIALVGIVSAFKLNAQDGLFLGGGLMLQSPTNQISNESFGFQQVANVGGGMNVSSLWFFNPRLALGSEIAYSYFPKDKKTWNQERYGNIKVNYQMLNLSAQGNIYFSDDEIKPYAGAVFGLYYLRNMLDFDSRYSGTTNDASISYVSNTVHAGFGLESGVLFELSQKSLLCVSIRYTTIPDIKPEYYPENDVTINPHGKENHWGLSVLLYFGS